MKTCIVILSKQIRLRVRAESEHDAVAKVLQREDEGEHLVQWVDALAMVGLTGVEEEEEEE
jgi:hypothetical protein